MPILALMVFAVWVGVMENVVSFHMSCKTAAGPANMAVILLLADDGWGALLPCLVTVAAGSTWLMNWLKFCSRGLS